MRITRAVPAADCGRVVNPDTPGYEIQGGVVSAITAIHYSQITFANGRAELRNVNTYRTLRIDAMPKIETHILPSSENCGGIGESGGVVD